MLNKAKELFYDSTTSQLVANNVQSAIDEIKEKIDSVKNNLSGEVTDRKNADTALQTAINKEVTDRKNADTTISNKLASTDAWVKRLIPSSSIISTLPTPTTEETLFVSSNDGTFPYSFGLLEIRRGANYSEFTALFRATGNNNGVYYNTYLSDAWTGWKQISDCLPLSGGKIKGSVHVTGTTTVAFIVPESSGTNNIGMSTNYFNNIYSTNFTKASSKRFKENIADIEDSEYEKLLNIRPVSFDYKKSFVRDKNRKHHRGFIAEEVYEQYPNFVEMDDSGMINGVKYIEFIPEIIGLLQEHNKRIKELEKERVM